MTIHLPPLTLIIGGAASGKSTFAERLVEGTGKPMFYVATAQAYDAEMQGKIAEHQARRGAGWTTVEAPRDIAAALASADETQVVLLDCLTLWLTNTILADADLVTEGTALLTAFATCAAPVVAVTNEVGAGIVPDNALARRFRGAQGRLNQSIAAKADLVVTVMAGLPLVLKGSLPEGAA